MKHKRHETLWATVFSIGLLFIFGVGGGLEQNTLSIGQAIIFAIVGFTVMIFGAKKGGFWQ